MQLRKKIIAIIVVVGIIVIVFISLFIFVTSIEEPYVQSIQNRWGIVSEDELQILTKVYVRNPNSFGLILSSINYRILLNDFEIANGTDTDIGLEKNDVTLLNYTSMLNTRRLSEWWASHINNNETTHVYIQYDVDAKLGPFKKTKSVIEMYNTVNTNVTSMLSGQHAKDIVVNLTNSDQTTISNFHILTVKNYDVHWAYVDTNRTVADISVDLHNPHALPVDVVSFEYKLFMNGAIVGWGSLESSLYIAPHAQTRATCETVIYNDKIVEWFSTHINNGEKTYYELYTSATFRYGEDEYTSNTLALDGYFETNFLKG